MDYLLISFGILCLINILVSVYLYKKDDLEHFQKVAQIIVVWLLPFVGAIGLWLFHRSQDDDNKPSSGSFGGGSSSAGVASGAD